jgi:hypothetical protein
MWLADKEVGLIKIAVGEVLACSIPCVAAGLKQDFA